MTIELLAPAKINLGLEVLRKRDDGFHEIATVFQTISIFDRLRIDSSTDDTVELVNQTEPIEANLAERALKFAQIAELTSNSHRVSIEKRIPIAAGLGGASTDAAAVLHALAPDRAAGVDELALQLGSDVPFLLNGGAALASGRGEVLDPVPSLQDCWLVLGCPTIELARKTARLYGALTQDDFTDGSRIVRVAEAMRERTIPAADHLANAFSRPLATLMPNISILIDDFLAAGAPFVALSGAGPTHYTIVPALHTALAIAGQLGRSHALPLRVLVARPVPSGFQVRRHKTQSPATAL